MSRWPSQGVIPGEALAQPVCFPLASCYQAPRTKQHLTLKAVGKMDRQKYKPLQAVISANGRGARQRKVFMSRPLFSFACYMRCLHPFICCCFITLVDHLLRAEEKKIYSREDTSLQFDVPELKKKNTLLQFSKWLTLGNLLNPLSLARGRRSKKICQRNKCLSFCFLI